MSHSVLCSWTFGALFWDPVDLTRNRLALSDSHWKFAKPAPALSTADLIIPATEFFSHSHKKPELSFLLFQMCICACIYFPASFCVCGDQRATLGGQSFPFTWIPRIKFKSPGLPAEPSCWLIWGFLAWLCSLSLSCHLVSESPFPTQDSRQTFLQALGLSVSLESSLCSCLLCSSPGRSNLTS